MKSKSVWDGLPTAIKVGHRDFQVQIQDRDWSDRHSANGQCSKDQGLIHIAGHLSGALAAESVLHEVMHAAWYVWRVEDGDDEERTVTTLTMALSCIFRDNPDFVDWYMKTLC